MTNSPYRFLSADVALHKSVDGLQDLTVFSQALDRRADLTLFTPVEADPQADLPVVILLHGVYGSHWSWARNGNAHRILQTLTTNGEVAPAVLAMPSDGLFGVGSGYLHRPGDDAEQWITTEVLHAVRLVYPYAGSRSVSIAGLSMGGWGALRLAARYPTMFSSAVALSPLTKLHQVAGYAPDTQRQRHAPPTPDSDLADLLVRNRPTLPPLAIRCGVHDPLIESARELHRALLTGDVVHEYQESSGGHDWTYWSAQLPDALRHMIAVA